MKFWQRFRFFLVGFVPGLIILIFIINKNGCSSPNELKMMELRYQYLILGDKALCKLKCLGKPQKVFQINMRDFKVNYDLSDVRRKPYGYYYLQAADEKNALYEMAAEDRDTVTFINDIKLLNAAATNCNCDTIK